MPMAKVSEFVACDRIHFTLAEALEQVVGKNDEVLLGGEGIRYLSFAGGHNQELLDFYPGLLRQGENLVTQFAGRQGLGQHTGYPDLQADAENTAGISGGQENDCEAQVHQFNACQDKHYWKRLCPDSEKLLQKELATGRLMITQLHKHRIGDGDAEEIHEPGRTQQDQDSSYRGFPSGGSQEAHPVFET